MSDSFAPWSSHGALMPEKPKPLSDHHLLMLHNSAMRRSSVATALAPGTVDHTAWSKGTVPEFMELIMLSEEEEASLVIGGPHLDVKHVTASGDSAASSLPLLSLNSPAGANLGARARRLPTDGTGRRAVRPLRHDAHTAPFDTIVVPRAIADQIAGLRVVSSSSSPALMASVGTGVLDKDQAVTMKPSSPPKIFPTVRVHIDRHDVSAWDPKPPGQSLTARPRQSDLSWYRTELAMLRDEQ